jgi:hypothetical protein
VLVDRFGDITESISRRVNELNHALSSVKHEVKKLKNKSDLKLRSESTPE